MRDEATILSADLYAALGIRRPTVEEVVRRDAASQNPFHEGARLVWLIVVALLEEGRPMAIEELARKLQDAGCLSGRDPILTIYKSWHGLKPIVKQPDGRFWLETEHWRLKAILRELEILPKPLPAAPAPLPPIDDSTPVTFDEIAAALEGCGNSQMSSYRAAVAAIDAAGGPLTFEEIKAACGGKIGSHFRLETEPPVGWRSRFGPPDPAGRFVIAESADGVRTMRRVIRGFARPVLARRAQTARMLTVDAEWKTRVAETARRNAAENDAQRRAIVHGIVHDSRVVGVVVIDRRDRSLKSAVGVEAESVGEHLRSFDVLAGIGVDRVLRAVDLGQDAWKLVDLNPPRKTRQLNRARRILRITLPLILRSTVGITRSFIDPSSFARLLKSDRTTAARRRIESEAKALFALHEFGCLHRKVRLRWGFIDDTYPVEWAHPGMPRFRAQLLELSRGGRPIQFVFHSAPGWADPWSRAETWHVKRIDYFWFVAENAFEERVFRFEDVQALRTPPAST